MKTYNTAPYYDDFDQAKNFYQIMFNPGSAVQARELTQLQTILRNQIEKFGNHIFKHGSVVIPGNSFADLYVPYVTIESPTVSNEVLASYEGRIIAGPEATFTNAEGSITTRLRARIRKVVLSDGTNPTTLYLSYLSGTASTITFTANQTISLESTSTVPTYSQLATTSAINATGFGSMAFVNSGVYYVNGTFAYVAPQSVVMSAYTPTPTASVYLKINESIVGPEQDLSLLDPAQGSNNYAAPGADRVKIDLELVSIPSGPAWTSGGTVAANTFIISGTNPPRRYRVNNGGTLGTVAPTHDSGIVINGTVSLQYDGETTITNDYVELMRYDQGVLQEHLRNPQYSELEKSLARRTYDESGNYVVNGLQPLVYEHSKALGGLVPPSPVGVGNPDKLVVEVTSGKAYVEGFEVEKIAKTRITIDKARDADHIKSTDVSLRPTFGQYLYIASPAGSIDIAAREQITLWNDNDNTNGSATQIGTAKVLAIDYYTGSVASPNSSVYKLWITDVSLNSGQLIDNVGGIRYASGRAWVVGEYIVSNATGTFTQSQVVTHSSGRTGTVWYWNSATAQLFLYKHDHTQPAPRVGDLITQSSPAVTATVNSRVIVGSEGQSTLIFPLPKSIVNTLQPYDIDYVVQKQYSIETSNGTGSVNVTGGTPIVDAGTAVVIKSDGSVGQGALSIPSGTTLQYAKAVGETDGIYTVYVQVAKSSPSLRTKQLTTQTLSGANAITVGSDQSVVLLQTGTAPNIVSYVDVIKIISVKLVAGGTTTDVTSSYTLNTGQTDYNYGTSSLQLRPGASVGAGSLEVEFQYYQHSPGDFFCIDSYSGIQGFRDKITSFTSPTTGQTYDLLSSIDFRTSGTSSSDVVVSGTAFSTPIKYYVPRIDALAIDGTGQLTVLRGVPAEQPKPPNVPSNLLALNYFYIPEYTRSVASVITTRLDVERFTMRDIQKIVDRVERLEEFATLSAAETDVINYEIVDPTTGLTRFKTGYLVENFVQPLAIARTTSRDFAATFVGRTLQPGQEKLICPLIVGTLPGTVVNKNGFLMLNYTEEEFINQPVSSRVTTVNPFATISWNGILTVNPPQDEWVDIIELATIFETQEEFVDVPVTVPVPLPPVTPPGFTTNRPPAMPPRAPDVTISLDIDLGIASGLASGRAGATSAVNWWTSTLDNQAGINAINAALSEEQNKYPSRSLVDISLSAQLDPIVQGVVPTFASSLSVVGSSSSVQSTAALISGGTQRITAR